MRDLECRYCVAPKRHPGCQGTCESYIRWREEYDKEQKVIHEYKNNQRILDTIPRKVGKRK